MEAREQLEKETVSKQLLEKEHSVLLEKANVVPQLEQSLRKWTDREPAIMHYLKVFPEMAKSVFAHVEGKLKKLT